MWDPWGQAPKLPVRASGRESGASSQHCPLVVEAGRCPLGVWFWAGGATGGRGLGEQRNREVRPCSLRGAPRSAGPFWVGGLVLMGQNLIPREKLQGWPEASCPCLTAGASSPLRTHLSLNHLRVSWRHCTPLCPDTSFCTF